jgi:predicted nucleotidyltransferase component of viral defense system
VRRGPIKDIAASVRARLLDKARREGRPFNELLQYYAMERFLYRLSQSPHADLFVLKGALVLRAWGLPPSRPTKDIDLLGRVENRVERLVAIARDVCATPVEPDGVVFDPASARGRRIAEEGEYEGVRVRLRGSLGKARLALQVDIGFGDPVTPAPAMMEYPTLLGMAAPRLRGYGKESSVAEKFEAMARRGLAGSRMKDFHDVWFLSRTMAFDGPALAKAIAATFRARGMPVRADAVALTAAFARDEGKQAQWRAFARRSRLADAPALGEVVAALGAFLRPVARALEQGARFEGRWEPSGPWREA